MLGLIGTVGGAAALELRRWKNRGSIQELNEYKRKERELRELLEVTNTELDKVKQQSDAAEVRAQELQVKAETLEQQAVHLEQEKAELQQQTRALGQQKEQLQQNNSKLVLSNLMLLNKAKHLEDNSRALIAQQEDLQHQLQQLQRNQQAAEATFEASLAALKEQVTAVLNKYFSKDLDLQSAIGEMQSLGIQVVPLEEFNRQMDEHTVDFETKLVLDSPSRMQRLMSAGSLKAPQLNSRQQHGADMARLAQLPFPMAISKDPTTGAPRITLAWRTDPAAAASPAHKVTHADTERQQQVDQQSPPKATKVAASSGTGAVHAIKAATATNDKFPVIQERPNGQALTFTSPQKQKSAGSGFSLGFGSFGKMGSSSGSKVPGGPALLVKGGGMSKTDGDEFASSSRDVVSHGRSK